MTWSAAAIAKRSKYRAVRTVIDGITFASKGEAARYAELKMLEKAGKIYALELQVSFPLHVTRYLLGGFIQREIIGSYVADFCYTDEDDGVRVIEDFKGFRTPLYRWKKKHFEAEYGFSLLETGRKR